MEPARNVRTSFRCRSREINAFVGGGGARARNLTNLLSRVEENVVGWRDDERNEVVANGALWQPMPGSDARQSVPASLSYLARFGTLASEMPRTCGDRSIPDLASLKLRQAALYASVKN